VLVTSTCRQTYHDDDDDIATEGWVRERERERGERERK